VSLEPTPSVALRVEQLRKVFSKNVYALRGVDLEVAESEFVTLLGPSGSGKTTLLMIIAGFVGPDGGRVFAAEKDITAVPAERRNFGVVFQNYALFPHMTVQQNVAYPLVARRVPHAERRSRVNEALELVDLSGFGRRRPGQLSGGQQQRVALARALVYQPSALLLDEPLGALDRALRERMQIELRSLNRRLGITFLYVTHDQDEALTMSDRIIVIRDGQIEQVGTPQEVYGQPATLFVANFVGASNVFRAEVLSSNGSNTRVRLTPGSDELVLTGMRVGSTTEIALTVRPERVRVEARRRDVQLDEAIVEGILEQEVFAGDMWRYFVAAAGMRIEARMLQRAGVAVGDRVHATWNSVDTWVIPNPKDRP
jgi:putative spermidine/putrescine transport system ATP-binding protein